MIETIFDVETTVGEYLGRKGSPFSDGGIRLCAAGFLHAGDEYEASYLVSEDDARTRQGVIRGTPEWEASFPDLTGVDVLVGHNIKFDLLWFWRHPNLERFIKAGGTIWDTAYAEYLLSAQFYNLAMPEHLRPSLKYCCKRRGLTQKLDVVAALWEQGVRTEDINEDILMEYLKGDCVSTKELFHDQLAQAGRQQQLHMIKERMDGLLATTEMEYNGLLLDLDEAKIQQEALENQIEELRDQLQSFVPAMPAECEFNWNSRPHLSALLFGGDIKYKKKVDILDKNGKQTFYQTKEKRVLIDKKTGEPQIYKSGKNMGKVKTKQITVPDYARGPKQRYEYFYHTLPRMTQPHHAWKAAAEGQWSTAAGVLEVLGKRDLPLVHLLLELRGAEKDLGTYYQRLNKGKMTGMLTMVDGDGYIHHNLNHYITGTGRLSSSKPNLQNLPGISKSMVRKLFVSRFGADGLVAEGDYSQLEVVCKGVLSGDKALLQALVDGVCFHCDWLALSPLSDGKSYEEVFDLCKVQHDPVWTAKRKQIKPLTFGEAYGAGVTSLAESTGMTSEQIIAAIEARKLKYPDVYRYDEENIEAVKASRRVSEIRTQEGLQAGIGYLRTATDTIYHFLEGDAPDWMRHNGIMTSFTPTTIKNYPSQGLGGEIMQVALGRLFRWLMLNDRFDDKVLLINTVHDCVWLDLHKDYRHVLTEAQEIMEDVSPYFNEHYPNVNWTADFPVEFEVGPNFYELEIIH